jgi:hypothetical protein
VLIVLDVIAGGALAGAIAAVLFSLGPSASGTPAFHWCLGVGLSLSGLILLVSMFARVASVALASGAVGAVVSLQAVAVGHVQAVKALNEYAAMRERDEDSEEPPWWPEFEARFAEACRAARVEHREDA